MSSVGGPSGWLAGWQAPSLFPFFPFFSSSLPASLPVSLFSFHPFILPSIPPSLSFFSPPMFLIFPAHIPENFINLSYIIYDPQDTVLSLTCLGIFPGLMCLYQPGIRTQQKVWHKPQEILVLICWNLLGISPSSELSYIVKKWKNIWVWDIFLMFLLQYILHGHPAWIFLILVFEYVIFLFPICSLFLN